MVRVKDRFTSPSPGGWRDVMINYVVRDDPYQHICEMQVTHQKLVTQRKGLHAHAVYDRTRNAAELLEKVRARPPLAQRRCRTQPRIPALHPHGPLRTAPARAGSEPARWVAHSPPRPPQLELEAQLAAPPAGRAAAGRQLSMTSLGQVASGNV